MTEVQTKPVLPGAVGVTMLPGEKLHNAVVFATVPDLLETKTYERIVLHGVHKSNLSDVLALFAQTAAPVLLIGEQYQSLPQQSHRAIEVVPDSRTFLKMDPSPYSTFTYVGRAVSPALCRHILLHHAAYGGRDVCFSDYSFWLADQAANDMIRDINRHVIRNESVEVTAYVMDPRGRPKILIGHCAAK